MKAIIRFCKNLSQKQFTKTLTAIFLIASFVLVTPLTAQINYTWIGAGTLNGSNTILGQTFSNPLNWNPVGIPGASDNVFMSFTGGTTVNLTGNTIIGNFTLIMLHSNINNLNNNNNPDYFNVGAFTLTVNGTTTMDVQDDHPNNQFFVGVTDGSASAGTIDFKGDVVIGTTNVRDGVLLTGNTNSTIICRGNLTLNTRAQVAQGSEPGTLLFDGTGTQNFIFNNAKSCGFRNVVVGLINNPTVVMGGTVTPDNIVGNLTVNGSSILDLNTRQLNRSSNGGSLFLKNTSIFRVAGLSSTSNGGSASLIPGSNFPSGFSNIVLDSTSTVEFYGTTQSIPGAAHAIKSYGNLMLTNNTKTLISSFAMYRNLSIAANTTMALNNFDDTLKSNSQTTAYVSLVPTSAVINYGTGGFVVERYLAAYKSWRLLATPLDTATSPTISAAWREGNAAFTSTGYGTQITGPQGPATATPAAVLDLYTQRGSIKSYNPAIDNYVEVANANTTKIANTAGYYVFVRGDRSVGISGGTGPTNLRIKGRIRTGNQTFTVPTNKFASVGNPFASRIDFRTIYNNSISPSYYVWNPNPAGTFYNAGKYEVYVNYGDGNYRLGNAAGPIHNYIESGQAVFIQSITGGTITIKEGDKFGGSTLVSRGSTAQRQAVNKASLEINLLTKDGSGQEVLGDAAVINFDAAYSNQIDNNDVRKILNTSDNLSIKKGSTNLVMETRTGLTLTDTIFLNLSNTRIGNYHFNIDPSLLSYPTLQAFLKDKFLQTETAVSFEAATDYTFTTTADAASRATDRFMIVFKSVLPAVITTLKANREDDNSVAVTWAIANENNINYYEIERSVDGINFKTIYTQLPTANNMGNPYYKFVDNGAPLEIVWYRIKANAVTGGIQFSATANAKAVDINTKHGVSVYPNPVVDGNINLSFNNKTQGTYSITILNNVGAIIKTTTVNVINNASVKKIKTNEAAAGIYRVTIKDVEGNTVVIPFVIL